MHAFAIVLMAGITVGYLRGGHILRLGEVRTRGLWLAAPALAVGAYFTLALGPDVPTWAPVAHLATYSVALLVACANWSLPGVRTLCLGLVLNATVIGLNGGLMPEAPETLDVNHRGVALQSGQHIPRSKNVLLERSETRLWWLSDVLATPPGFPLPMVASVGDLFIMVGLASTVQGVMVSRRNYSTSAV